MKKQRFLSLISLLLLTSCQFSDSNDYITFKEYIEIVNNQQENSQDIFIFTSTTCPHCQKIAPLIDRFIYENENTQLHIYELSVDLQKNITGDSKFKDKTLGVLSGDSSTDALKKLDNRITQYVKATNINVSLTSEIFESTGSSYSYVCTPLMIWYENQIEVKIVNNVEQVLEKNKKGDFTYESFVKMLEFPIAKPNWDRKFDLTYIK